MTPTGTKSIPKTLVAPWVLAIVASCGGVSQPKSHAQAPPSHQPFTVLLQEFVDGEGMVDYAGLQADSARLNAYLAQLEAHPPSSEWSSAEQLAYWLNAYNAYTLQLICRHYPVASIRDIGGLLNIPHIDSAWDIKFIRIGGESYDLNNIEHGIIREEWDEPRIHFALVCAARSCPRLRREAYTAEQLDTQLADQTVTFLRDTSKNQVSGHKWLLSKIFRWYSGDFSASGGPVAFISQALGQKPPGQIDVEYIDYDWSLNVQ